MKELFITPLKELLSLSVLHVRESPFHRQRNKAFILFAHTESLYICMYSTSRRAELIYTHGNNSGSQHYIPLECYGFKTHLKMIIA